jgi:hypothetical protein
MTVVAECLGIVGVYSRKLFQCNFVVAGWVGDTSDRTQESSRLLGCLLPSLSDAVRNE